MLFFADSIKVEEVTTDIQALGFKFVWILTLGLLAAILLLLALAFVINKLSARKKR